MRIVRFTIKLLLHPHRRNFFVLLLLLTMAGCSPDSGQATQRWYSQQQVDDGAEIFQPYCASCHGEKAQSKAGWKKADEQGHYPAPPLDGTAHAWHHDLSVLRRTTVIGGPPLGGRIPGFKGQLSDVERESVIAYFHSFWPYGIYAYWARSFLIA